jgi:hypothetical protein
MEKDNNERPQDEKREEMHSEKVESEQQETEKQHASTYQPAVEPTITNSENSGREQEEEQSGNTETQQQKTKFNFEKSMEESKGIFKDAILKPHSVIASNRSISWETSVLIFAVLSILVGIFAYFAVGNVMDNLFGGLGSFFGGSIGIDFLFMTILGWLATFAVGYFSIYFMLSYFGGNKMEHPLLLTKYVTVNIPFVLVFLIVFILFGFVMMDWFIMMYTFALMLFGVVHIYLFLTNVKKPKYDLFWLSCIYLAVLFVATYLITGIDFGLF